MKHETTKPTDPTSKTECKEQAILFPELISSKTVTVDFEGGQISSDGGATLLGRLDSSYGYLKRFAACFTDHRKAELIEHPVLDLMRQRIYGLALGYEDLNDHDSFIDEFVRSLSRKNKAVVLDLDRTNDTVHGEQEGRFFHGYYGEYCYTPFYIFCGKWPVVAALHTAESEHQDEVQRLVGKVVERVRRRFPRRQIILRADSGYCRDGLMRWCEEAGVFYVFGLQKNEVLKSKLSGSLRKAKALFEDKESGSQRIYKDFKYRAEKWAPDRRRVIGKAEWTPEGPNPRYIITNLTTRQYAAKGLYEELYCARGEMENRIKEQQLDLYADRTSTKVIRANQLRLWFSTLAYLLMNKLREVALKGTELAQATCGTIRLRLLKIGAVVKVTVRRVWIHLSSAYPLKDLFSIAASRLGSAGSG